MKNDTGAELLAVDPESRSIDDRDCCGDKFAGVDRSKIGEVSSTSTVDDPMEAAAVDDPSGDAILHAMPRPARLPERLVDAAT